MLFGCWRNVTRPSSYTLRSVRAGKQHTMPRDCAPRAPRRRPTSSSAAARRCSAAARTSSSSRRTRAAWRVRAQIKDGTEPNRSLTAVLWWRALLHNGVQKYHCGQQCEQLQPRHCDSPANYIPADAIEISLRIHIRKFITSIRILPRW